MKKQLTIKKPNRLDFFGVRTPNNPPPHFEYIHIPMRYNLDQTIGKWIKSHLKGRFYIGRGIHVDTSNTMSESLKVGFEEPKELSYFTLACPHLKYK